MKITRAIFLFSCCLQIGFAQKVLVIAHRGASGLAMENSISAFDKAIQSGADYIETDVHQTKDSVVVVMHDFSVNRTCVVTKELKNNYGAKAGLKEISVAEFRGLKLKGSEEAPPTLEEAIKFIGGRCRLMIELKKGSDYYPGIEERILKIIRENHAENWVDVIHSFDKKALLRINKEQTGMKLQRLIVFKLPLTSFNFSKTLNKDKFENWSGVNVYYRFITKKLVRRLHRQHKTVFAWTVNKTRAARRLVSKGVDGIITNRPDILKEIIGNK